MAACLASGRGRFIGFFGRAGSDGLWRFSGGADRLWEGEVGSDLDYHRKQFAKSEPVIPRAPVIFAFQMVPHDGS